MIYLKKRTTFDIKVDNYDHDLIVGEGVEYEDVIEGTLDYVRMVLLNRELDVPIHLYRVYTDLKEPGSKGLANGKYHYDLLVMPPNVAGVEYVKTHGHMTPVANEKKGLTYPVLIEILYGSATFLIQKFDEDFDPVMGLGSEVEELYTLKAPKGSVVVIPPNYYYTMINTRNSYLITSRIHYKWDTPSERSRIEEKHGAPVYIIRKNARQEIVKNPHYRNVGKPVKLKLDTVAKLVGIRSSKPIIEQFNKDPKKFDWLEKPGKIKWDF